jgi:hypothetical protein
LRRPVIEDVLDVLQEIRKAHAMHGASKSTSTLRREAVKAVAWRELDQRFGSRESAEKSIYDACSRRLQLAIAGFDVAVGRWLSGDPSPIQGILERVHRDADHRATIARLLATPPVQAVAIDNEEDHRSPGAGAPSAGDSERTGALEHVRSQQEAAGAFAPSGLEDACKRILTAIIRRQGQPAFRRQLLRSYGGQCAISGCNVAAALDAAHIVPYKGPDTNNLANGLLLRTDLHTLFDLGLVAVDTETMSVLIAPSLVGTYYQQYSGKRLSLPSDPGSHPSREALDQHRAVSSVPKRTQ